MSIWLMMIGNYLRRAYFCYTSVHGLEVPSIACRIPQRTSLTETIRSSLKPGVLKKLAGALCCLTNCIFNQACRNIGIGYAGLLSVGRIARAEVGNVWKKAIMFCAKEGLRITTQIISFQAEIISSSSRIRFGMCCSVLLGERLVCLH
jgi:hypothetical protein